MAEDYAATCRVKELLDEWDEEATRLEARAHRARQPTEGGALQDEARAMQLRECLTDLSAVFPDAKAWHKEGVVPATGPYGECAHPGVEAGATCPACDEFVEESEAAS
ncbi:MAG TPA: hypothetical protein VGK73_33350 [Polyangiaceae bacterium]